MGQVYYGSGLCEILKNVKVGKNAKSERGKCPQYGFERVLNLDEVEFWGEVLWEGPMSINLASLLSP